MAELDNTSRPERENPKAGDNYLAEARRLIGIDLRSQRGTMVVTRDEIKKITHLMGSDNPLYCDENYARKTKWQGLIAPPYLLQFAGDFDVAPGLPGITWIYGGSDWEWYHIVREGDVITQRGRLLDAVEKVGTSAGRFIIQYGELIYYNQRDEVVAKNLPLTARTLKRSTKSGGGMHYKERLHKYTAGELAAVEAAVDAEKVRGANPRYWEDVTVGDEIGPLVKGPYRVLDMIYGISSHNVFGNLHMGSHIIQYLRRKEHPGDAYMNPKTGAADHPFRGHWDPYMAHEAGMPNIYDIGQVTRGPWTSQLVTDWMGDDGFLKKLTFRIRLPKIMGDTTWCKGKVIKKYVQEDEYLVDCEIWFENQLKEITVSGSATVRLPHKNGQDS